MKVSFDEFHLDVGITYPGKPLTRAGSLPSIEDMVDEKSCVEMSMFMVQKYCDRCLLEQHHGANVMKLHFVH